MQRFDAERLQRQPHPIRRRRWARNPNYRRCSNIFIPPMHVASVVGWKGGEKPSVPDNLKIDAIAIGLQHPRSLYTLPNGDILVVEVESARHRADQAP